MEFARGTHEGLMMTQIVDGDDGRRQTMGDGGDSDCDVHDDGSTGAGGLRLRWIYGKSQKQIQTFSKDCSDCRTRVW